MLFLRSSATFHASKRTSTILPGAGNMCIQCECYLLRIYLVISYPVYEKSVYSRGCSE